MATQSLGCYLDLACLRRLGVSPRPPRNETGGGDLWLLGYTRQGLGAKAQIWGNRKVVRCFIGAIFGHSQVPGPLRGLEIPANEFSLCDSSLEQGLTLLTQLVKLLHPLCRRLYRQLLG